MCRTCVTEYYVFWNTQYHICSLWLCVYLHSSCASSSFSPQTASSARLLLCLYSAPPKHLLFQTSPTYRFKGVTSIAVIITIFQHILFPTQLVSGPSFCWNHSRLRCTNTISRALTSTPFYQFLVMTDSEYFQLWHFYFQNQSFCIIFHSDSLTAMYVFGILKLFEKENSQLKWEAVTQLDQATLYYDDSLRKRGIAFKCRVEEKWYQRKLGWNLKPLLENLKVVAWITLGLWFRNLGELSCFQCMLSSLWYALGAVGYMETTICGSDLIPCLSTDYFETL